MNVYITYDSKIYTLNNLLKSKFREVYIGGIHPKRLRVNKVK